jgi:RHS repeat-associated protein
MEPSLGLAYSSRRANGLLGVGWALQGFSSITRCKRDMARDGRNAAIQFDQSDAFCLDGQRLVPFPDVNGGTTGQNGAAGTEYRTEEDHFARIINGPTDEEGPISFEVRLKDGRILLYGTTPDSRLEGKRFQSVPASLAGTTVKKNLNQTVRLTWSLAEVRDRFGNTMTLQYSVTGDPANSQGYEQLPQSIRYTGTLDGNLLPQRMVTFEYETRSDTPTTFVSGLRLQVRHRLTHIVLSAPSPTSISAVKSYVLKYQESNATRRSLLSGVLECDVNQVCLAPTAFSYSNDVATGFTDIDTGIHDDTATGESTPSVGPKLGQLTVGDFNGDGCDDLIYTVLDKDSNFFEADYRLSACFDKIAANPSGAFPTPNPSYFYILSPVIAGAPDSQVPPAVFNPPPSSNPKRLANCILTTHYNCTNTELLALDMDLDGRADLLSYVVHDQCSTPDIGCDTSTAWEHDVNQSVFLASSIAPAQWNPFSGLFAGQTSTFSATKTGKPLFGGTVPGSFYYHDLYVGDINGDGFPDLVRFVAGESPQAQGGALTSWISSTDNLEHVAYIGTDGHICELYAAVNGSWRFDDVTVISGAPTAQGGALTSWFSPTDNLQHIAYIDGNGNVDELYLEVGAGGASWAFDQPTQISGAPKAQGGALTSWFSPTDNLQHIAYIDGNGSVDELYLKVAAAGANWAFDGPTQISGAPKAQDGALNSWFSPSDNLQHIAYIDGNGNVDELYLKVAAGGANWAFDQPTQISGAPKAQGGALTSWFSPTDNLQHIAYIDGNGNVDELYLKVGAGGASWAFDQPTQISGAPKAQGGALTSWFSPTDNLQHIAYIDGNGSIDELYLHTSTGAANWAFDNATADTKIYPNAQRGAITSWVSAADNIQHIAHIEVGHIFEFWMHPGQRPWALHDVTTISGSGWTFELNHGRALVPPPLAQCGGTGSPCLALDSEKLFFPGTAPSTGFVNVFMLDVNGDGITDFLLRDPNGPNWYAAFSLDSQNNPRPPINLALASGENFSRHDWFVDVNGDGLPDSVSIPRPDGGSPWIAVNTGNGFDTPVEVKVGYPPPSETIAIFDYDGNGTEDVVYGDGLGLHALLSNRGASHDDYSLELVDLTDQNLKIISKGTGLVTLDANGDGQMDLAQIVGGTIHVYIRQGMKADLLSGIVDRGARLGVGYAPVTSASVYRTTVPPGVVSSGTGVNPSGPTYVLNRGALVVSGYTIPRAGSLGSSAPPNQYQLSYQDGRNSLLGRGWLGFGSVTITDMQTKAQSTTNYENGKMIGSAYPFANRPHSKDTFTPFASTGRFNERIETTTYQAGGSTDGTHFVVQPREITQQEYEGFFEVSRDLIRSIDTKIEYDNFGNPKTVARSTGDGYVDSRTATYQSDPGSWLLSMRTNSVDASTTPTGATGTRTTAFIPNAATGVMSARIIEPNGDEASYNRTDYSLDAHGVLTKIAVHDLSKRKNRTLTLNYDSEDLFLTSQTNALGRMELFAIHPAFGVLADHEDENGIHERRQYDGFGRLRSVLTADGGNLAVTYKSSLFPELDLQYANGRTFSVYSDPFLNEVERDWTGFDGQTVIELTSYNNQGLVAERDGPCLYGAAICAASGSEQYSYDELGRPLNVQHADGSNFQAKYSGLQSTTYDELQNEHYFLEDQLGRMSKSVGFNSQGKEVPTTFTYEPFGLLHTVSDAGGHAIQTVHDTRGRPVSVNDPDSGKHLFKWTTFDELEEEQEANGFVTRYQRDILGRIQNARDHDGTTEFCWDTALHGIGKIGRTRSADHVTTQYEYDPLGKIKTSVVTVGRNKYAFGMSYDPFGRLETVTYPGVSGQPPFVIRQEYTRTGFLKRVVNATTGSLFWQINAQNERGQTTNETFGNGLTTERTFDNRGFLRTVTTSGNAATQQHLTYEYYPTGSLHWRNNLLSGSTVAEEFHYDPLDRLQEWAVTEQTNGAKNPISLLDQTFDYDDFGNIRQRVTTSGSVPTLTYQYGQNGAGPHAVTQINSDVYQYDSAGNQVTGPNRRIRYKAFGLPSNIKTSGSTFSFLYDASHQRVLKQGSNGDTTVYINGLYEHRLESGKATDVFYVLGGGRVIAQQQYARPPTGNKLFYLHDDHLVSTNTVTENGNPAGTLSANYEPFGQLVDSSNPANALPQGLDSVKRQFTGQSVDSDLGLIDMKGRIYDPNMSHFLTPDPQIQDFSRSESLNRYSYAWNNPLKWVDPSGFQNSSDDPGIGGAPQSCAGQSNCTEIVFDEDFIEGQAPANNATTPASTASDNGVSESSGSTNVSTPSIFSAQYWANTYKGFNDYLDILEAQQEAYDAASSRLYAEEYARLMSERGNPQPWLTDPSNDFTEVHRRVTQRIGERPSNVVNDVLLTYSAAAAGAGLGSAFGEVAPLEAGELAGIAETGQIPYASSDLSQEAIAYRVANKITGGRNVSVYEYQAADGSLQTIARASQRGVGHAERIVGGELEGLNVDPSRVTRIYSELQPCNMPGGYCAGYLARTFPQAQVTWSFEYGATPASRAAGVAALKSATENLGP